MSADPTFTATSQQSPRDELHAHWTRDPSSFAKVSLSRYEHLDPEDQARFGKISFPGVKVSLSRTDENGDKYSATGVRTLSLNIETPRQFPYREKLLEMAGGRGVLGLAENADLVYGHLRKLEDVTTLHTKTGTNLAKIILDAFAVQPDALQTVDMSFAGDPPMELADVSRKGHLLKLETSVEADDDELVKLTDPKSLCVYSQPCLLRFQSDDTPTVKLSSFRVTVGIDYVVHGGSEGWTKCE